MFFAFVLMILAAAVPNFVDAELKHLIVTYRSQEHTPVKYDETFTIPEVTETKAKLTVEGQEKAFGLGRELAKTYGRKLNLTKKWKNGDFWSFSSNSTRTQWSALLVAAGLRKDGKGSSQTFTNDQLAAATYNLTDSFSKFLFPAKCPAYYQLLAGKKANLDALNNRYKDALDAVAKKYPGVRQHHYRAWITYETLATLKHNGRQSEIDQGINKQWQNLKKLSEGIIFTSLSTKGLKKIAGGRILDDIMQDLEAKVEGKKIPHTPSGKDVKASLFGSSQAMLAAQLAAFNPNGTKYNGSALTSGTFYPENGAVHIVELHQEGKKWKVKVLYRQKGGEDYKEAKFPGCVSTRCDFDKFKEAVKDLRVAQKDLDNTCKKKSDKKRSQVPKRYRNKQT